MSLRWPARLGLVSMSVLALAACNRSPNTAEPAGSASTAAVDAAHDTAVEVESLGASEAAAPVGPAVSKAAAAVSPDIAAARAFDTSVTNAAANTVDAYKFDESGEEVRAWNDPRLGSRIVTRGGDGYVVSYYRPGANAPYVMRQGEIYYLLSGGHIVRAYDGRGRAVVIKAEDRDRWDKAVDRSSSARRAADKRHAALVEARQASKQAANAVDTAKDASREANQAEGRAERAADKAQDAAKDARQEARNADNPAERKDAQQAARDANKSAGQAERAADKAEKASDAARDAHRDARDQAREAQRAAAELKARCDRARARGEKVGAECAGVK